MLLLTAAAFWAYLKYADYNRIDPLQLIPSDAIYILETDAPLANWQEFYQSPFWRFLQHHPDLQEITQEAQYLDSLIQSNQSLLKHFGDHHLILSAHMISNRDYEFIFAFDLQKASKFSLTQLPLQSLLGKEFKVIEQTYREEKLLKIMDLSDQSSLYLAQSHNYLLCSYNLSLIHASLDQRNLESVGGEDFKQVYSKVTRKGLGQFYINYAFLDDYISLYFSNDPSMEQALGQLSFSSMDLNLKSERIEATGYSSIAQDAAYTSLLHQFGNGKRSFHHSLSNRVALLQSIHIHHVDEFYDSLLVLRSQAQADLAAYQSLKMQLEKRLQLSLEDDLLSWVGDEILFAQLAARQGVSSSDDLLVAIKASDLELCKSKLAKIQKQIKKRSPAKFKHISYKGHSIHYLDLKGMFKLFFGRAFNKITKPYYIVLNEHVIFSNSPKTLIALIEDYENGKVLANDADFLKLHESLPSELALFSYVNPQLLYPILKRSVSADLQDELQENKAYFEYFNQCALGFRASTLGFENRLILEYGKPKKQYEFSASNQLYTDYAVDLASLDGAGNFVLEEIDQGIYYKYFPQSKLVMVKAETKNGLLHGRYWEYYSNAELKAKGKYRKGKKTGRWIYYDQTGHEIGRERF